jgi:hypothetical protein
MIEEMDMIPDDQRRFGKGMGGMTTSFVRIWVTDGNGCIRLILLGRLVMEERIGCILSLYSWKLARLRQWA